MVGCYPGEEEAAKAAEQVTAAVKSGVSLPVCLASGLVRYLHQIRGSVYAPVGGGVVSASFLNAKHAVGGIGVEPRRGDMLRVLFAVESDAVADAVVRNRCCLCGLGPSVAVFDVLSDREEARHQALWPAFLAAKAAGKRVQFHRARLVVDGARPNRPAVQAAFIEERIRPLAAGQTHLVLAGDFNFVESPRNRARSEGPLEWRDRAPAAAMAALVEDSPLRDAYRLIHPMQRGYTFSAYNAQARLDRLYVSMALVPRVLGCDAGESGGSDHRVVAMHLSPLVPESRGPGRPRVRAHFWADRDLADGFRAWFGREAAGAPTHGHTELMRWWQAFKPRLAREARRLDCDLGRRQDAVSVEVTRLRADLQRARAAVEAGRDGLAELAGLYALQRRLDAAVRRYAPAPPACVRPGERVSGGMAAAFRKPAAARRVAALRDARGILVTDGRGMADIMADAVAAVSRPPPPSPADREAVLGAVRAHSPRVPQAVADAAGALVVTPAEVRAAATHSKPGTAPGPDGIPVDVWRKLGEPAFELLAAVFTAVGATGGTPPGFLDGVVASIYKAKNAADAANYRPLTMLGSDYRILAKVLATRWTPLLSAVVGPEQTAFLAGRRISDNICLTQMLPGLLAANAADGVGPTGAALALLDFRKAYDTIDRGFLIAVMEAVGVGDGVLAWTRTILTHTYASAEVNGFISAPRKYAAGVRQGCPAAPALFLFLGHALACFLRTCPAVGVEVVPGCRVTCPQYADDCMPLLRSCAPADVAALVETMAVFGRATGLILNLGKCGILPLGSAGEGLLAGAEVAGLRVLDAGVSLGVPVSAGLPPPEGVTGVCRERLAAAYTKLARFPMSAFGRGHAAATYGVSRILFRAVHCGMTPEAERVLSRWTATLVDRSVGPDPPAELPRWASSVPGAPAAMLLGRPAHGGFGAPAWREIVHGQWAVHLACLFGAWAAGAPHLLLPAPRAGGGGGAGGSGGGGGGGTQPEQQPAPPAQPAWQPLMVESVHRLCPEAHPSLFVLMAGLAPRAGALPDGLIGECVDPAVRAALLAGPMRRMLDGVQALGPVARITGRVQTAELWGAEAPLWANPLLQLELPAAQRSVQWREPTGDAAGHALFSPTDAARWLVDGLARVRDALPGMRTVTDLCVLWAWLAAVDMVRSTRTVDHACLRVYAAADPARARLVLGQIRAALACGAYDGGNVWRAVLCRALFPEVPPPVPGCVPDLLCVRRTLDPLFTAVAVVLAALPPAWVEAAAGGAALTVLWPLRHFQPLPQAGERAAVVEILQLVGWKLPSVITPAGWQRGRPGLRSTAAQPAPLPGGGGAAGEPRWVGFAHGPGVVGKLTCKLAVALQLRAVVDERRVRRAATVEAALALDHGPHGGPRATDAQVFAGLRGLEAAVPTLWRMPLLNARKEPIWRLWPPARSVAVERAGELATMDLWDALASFAEGGGMPRGWAGVVGPTHPFVGVVDGGLTLNKTS
ncbi:hypothetical protein FOA52_000131 [Chlamydomonas sp. UWO 241]|nr:hypothetical protein FOA52_000131 [Chlamydomonas sp. UWO 241]